MPSASIPRGCPCCSQGQALDAKGLPRWMSGCPGCGFPACDHNHTAVIGGTVLSPPKKRPEDISPPPGRKVGKFRVIDGDKTSMAKYLRTLKDHLPDS